MVDGQTLAPDLQLMLRLQRLARERGAETLPIAEGRQAMVHHTALTGGDLPIGERARPGRSPAGRPASTSRPVRAATGPLLVYFHGGGFMHGDLESHDAACRFLAERSGRPAAGGRLPARPGAPVPGGARRRAGGYAWAVEHAAELGADPDRLGVGGDSAGGNLAAGVAIEAARGAGRAACSCSSTRPRTRAGGPGARSCSPTAST